MIRLRGYQNEAVEAVLSDLKAGVKRPSVVIPCGGGKTLVFSTLADRWQSENIGKALILTHTNELAGQALAKFRSVVPGARIGLVKAESNDVDAPVIVGSVQTLCRQNRRDQLDGVGLIIADECHLALAPSWRSVLDHYDAPAVGFTATMSRGDGGRLGEVWKKISYQCSLLRMIRAGYLSDVDCIHVKVPDLDLTGLRSTAGDYRDGELGERLTDSMAPETIAKAYREHGCRPDGSVRPGLVFTPTVATAQQFAEALRAEGFRAEAVWGDMPKDERVRILGDAGAGIVGAYDRGEIDILVNAMLLTIGFDSPRAEIAVIARPTKSSTLFQQAVGRVLRLFPGKTMARVLDVVGASAQHELMTLATLGGDRLKQVREGQSLLAALDELEKAEADEQDQGYVGEVWAETVDLFAGSRQQWLRTEAGTWFLSASERFLFLHQTPTGQYDVGWVASKAKGGAWIARGVPDLSWAMAQGEGDITEDEEVMSARDRAWRKRRMTGPQMNYARQLRIPVDTLDPKTRAGTLGDLISIKLASRRLDRTLARRSV